MKKLLIIGAVMISAAINAQNLQTEATNMIGFASGHLAQLAEAIPAEKYNWSPGEGVRSVAGVLSHLVSANYFFATTLGGKLPEGVNMQTIEQDLKTKEVLLPALKQSTEFIIATIKGLPDNTLTNKVNFPFPGEYTTTSAILIAQGHCNEHLGQLIAYGRMNGIKPPWSE
jgi:uncharacterized damage-inducible protein DinB